MIDYLTHPKFLNCDPSILPSSQGGGGGMGTKTYRVLDALRDVYPRTQGICDASEITADTVLIDPLRFTLTTDGYGDREYENVEQLIHGLRNHKSRKILYCSELTLMRMPHLLREQVVELSDVVTANCKFQANVFKYVNVHTNHILCDPVPDVFLSRLSYRERKPRLVATGNVSWQKNAPQITEVFKGLKGAVERVYVGSASEIPAWSASGVRAQIEAIKRLASETDESLEEQSERISKWARENVSYGAFQGQLKEVLRSVW